MVDEESSVETAFTVTRDEYVRALRRHYRTKLQLKRDVVGGLAAVLGGIYLLRDSEASTIGWILLVPGCLLIALVLYATLLLPYVVYASQPKLKSEYRLSFRPEGIRFRTDAVDAELKWSIYHSWLRDDEFYIMYHGTRDITVVPRRAINGDADNRLAELLRLNVGAIAA